MTIDKELLDEARRTLGTADAQSTIEASLREVIRAHGEAVELPRFIRTREELHQFLRDLRRPRTAEELARREAAFQTAEKHRVNVGPGFNIVEEIREIRRRAAEGLPPEVDYDQ